MNKRISGGRGTLIMIVDLLEQRIDENMIHIVLQSQIKLAII
jgi:hypothetical protein